MSLLRRFFGFVASPSHSRTAGILVILIILAAVPLTVLMSQKQQETRQRASTQDCDTAKTAAEQSCTTTYNACNINCSNIKQETYSTYASFQEAYDTCATGCVGSINACNASAYADYISCFNATNASTPTSIPTLAPTLIPTSAPTSAAATTTCTKTGNTCTDSLMSSTDYCLSNSIGTEFECGATNYCNFKAVSCPSGTFCTLNPIQRKIDCVPVPTTPTPIPTAAITPTTPPATSTGLCIHWSDVTNLKNIYLSGTDTAITLGKVNALATSYWLAQNTCK